MKATAELHEEGAFHLKEAQGAKKKIEFASHPGNLSLMRDFVRKFLGALAFPDLEKDLMVLGIDEACTNVIRYAYDHETNQLISLQCEKTRDGVRFHLRDFGKKCAPEKLCSRPLDAIQPGGLGIHLIKRAFDKVDYQQQPHGTKLVLSRSFQTKN